MRDKRVDGPVAAVEHSAQRTRRPRQAKVWPTHLGFFREDRARTMRAKSQGETWPRCARGLGGLARQATLCADADGANAVEHTQRVRCGTGIALECARAPRVGVLQLGGEACGGARRRGPCLAVGMRRGEATRRPSARACGWAAGLVDGARASVWRGAARRKGD